MIDARARYRAAARRLRNTAVGDSQLLKNGFCHCVVVNSVDHVVVVLARY